MDCIDRIKRVSKTRNMWKGAAVLLWLLSYTGISSAQVSDLSYTLSPTAQRVNWAGDAGLKDGYQFGGSLGFGFGEFVQLSGLYMLGRDFATDFGDFSSGDSLFMQSIESIPSRDLELQRYGGELRLNIARGSITPFITAGTGLIKFEPKDLESFERIYLSGGAGVSFSVADRYRLSVQAQNLAYRYSPSSLFSVDELATLGDTGTLSEQQSVRNWAFSGSLSLFLGGRRPGQLSEIDRAFSDQFSSGLRGLSVTAEPFYGQISFDENLGYRTSQTVAGVGASFDFGPYLGLRGFYWRGLDGSAADDIQFYGGEMQFNLSDGEGVVPYLLIGGGYVDVLNGYQVPDALVEAKDNPFAVGGGGLAFPISPRFKLHAGVRAMLMSTDNLESISAPNQVQTSWMYTGGVKFALGGQRATRPDVLYRQEMEDEVARVQYEAALREAELNDAIAISQARTDSLNHALLLADARGDSLNASRLRLEKASQEAAQQRIEDQANRAAHVSEAAQVTAEPAVVRTASGDRFVTLPLPEEGELYIRFGTPGGVNIESTYEETGVSAPQPTTAVSAPVEPPLTNTQIRAIMSETLREALRLQETDSLRSQALPSQNKTGSESIDRQQEIFDQLQLRLDELERRIDSTQRPSQPAPTGDVRPPAGVTQDDIGQLERRFEDRLDDRIESLRAEIRAIPRSNTTPQPAPPAVVVVQPAESAGQTQTVEQVEVGSISGSGRQRPSYQLDHIRPFIGYNLGGDPNQFLVGLRAEWQQRQGTSAWRFLPELVLGFGEGSTMINPSLNVAVPVVPIQRLYPYVGGGLGLLGFLSAPDGTDAFEATLNLLVGTEFDMGTSRLFIEYANIDLSSYNRINAGYRLTF